MDEFMKNVLKYWYLIILGIFLNSFVMGKENVIFDSIFIDYFNTRAATDIEVINKDININSSGTAENIFFKMQDDSKPFYVNIYGVDVEFIVNRDVTDTDDEDNFYAITTASKYLRVYTYASLKVGGGIYLTCEGSATCGVIVNEYSGIEVTNGVVLTGNGKISVGESSYFKTTRMDLKYDDKTIANGDDDYVISVSKGSLEVTNGIYITCFGFDTNKTCGDTMPKVRIEGTEELRANFKAKNLNIYSSGNVVNGNPDVDTLATSVFFTYADVTLTNGIFNANESGQNNTLVVELNNSDYRLGFDSVGKSADIYYKVKDGSRFLFHDIVGGSCDVLDPSVDCFNNHFEMTFVSGSNQITDSTFKVYLYNNATFGISNSDNFSTSTNGFVEFTVGFFDHVLIQKVSNEENNNTLYLKNAWLSIYDTFYMRNVLLEAESRLKINSQSDIGGINVNTGEKLPLDVTLTQNSAIIIEWDGEIRFGSNNAFNNDGEFYISNLFVVNGGGAISATCIDENGSPKKYCEGERDDGTNGGQAYVNIDFLHIMDASNFYVNYLYQPRYWSDPDGIPFSGDEEYIYEGTDAMPIYIKDVEMIDSGLLYVDQDDLDMNDVVMSKNNGLIINSAGSSAKNLTISNGSYLIVNYSPLTTTHPDGTQIACPMGMVGTYGCGSGIDENGEYITTYPEGWEGGYGYCPDCDYSNGASVKPEDTEYSFEVDNLIITENGYVQIDGVFSANTIEINNNSILNIGATATITNIGYLHIGANGAVMFNISQVYDEETQTNVPSSTTLLGGKTYDLSNTDVVNDGGLMHVGLNTVILKSYTEHIVERGNRLGLNLGINFDTGVNGVLQINDYNDINTDRQLFYVENMAGEEKFDTTYLLVDVPPYDSRSNESPGIPVGENFLVYSDPRYKLVEVGDVGTGDVEVQVMCSFFNTDTKCKDHGGADLTYYGNKGDAESCELDENLESIFNGIANVVYNDLFDEDFSYGASVIVADDENVAKNMGEISPLQNSNRMQIDTKINDTLNSVIMDKSLSSLTFLHDSERYYYGKSNFSTWIAYAGENGKFKKDCKTRDINTNYNAMVIGFEYKNFSPAKTIDYTIGAAFSFGKMSSVSSEMIDVTTEDIIHSYDIDSDVYSGAIYASFERSIDYYLVNFQGIIVANDMTRKINIPDIANTSSAKFYDHLLMVNQEYGHFYNYKKLNINPYLRFHMNSYLMQEYQEDGSSFDVKMYRDDRTAFIGAIGNRFNLLYSNFVFTLDLAYSYNFTKHRSTTNFSFANVNSYPGTITIVDDMYDKNNFAVKGGFVYLLDESFSLESKLGYQVNKDSNSFVFQLKGSYYFGVVKANKKMEEVFKLIKPEDQEKKGITGFFGKDSKNNTNVESSKNSDVTEGDDLKEATKILSEKNQDIYGENSLTEEDIVDSVDLQDDNEIQNGIKDSIRNNDVGEVLEESSDVRELNKNKAAADVDSKPESVIGVENQEILEEKVSVEEEIPLVN